LSLRMLFHTKTILFQNWEKLLTYRKSTST